MLDGQGFTMQWPSPEEWETARKECEKEGLDMAGLEYRGQKPLAVYVAYPENAPATGMESVTPKTDGSSVANLAMSFNQPSLKGGAYSRAASRTKGVPALSMVKFGKRP